MTIHPAMVAVGELVRSHKLRIEVTPAVAYTVHAPCLLRQLADAATVGGERGGRGVPGSRSPINLDVSDLWYEIHHNTHGWAAHVGGIDRRDRDAGHAIPWVGRLLRTTTATAIGRGLVELVDRVEYDAGVWRGRIEAMVGGQPAQRGIYGARCPECEATSITELLPDGAQRAPAIASIVREVNGATLRWVTCLACGWYRSLAEEGSELVLSIESEVAV